MDSKMKVIRRKNENVNIENIYNVFSSNVNPKSGVAAVLIYPDNCEKDFNPI